MLERDPNTCLGRSMVQRKPRGAQKKQTICLDPGMASTTHDTLGACEGVEDLLGSLEGSEKTEGCPEGADDMLGSRVGIDDTLLVSLGRGEEQG